MMILERYNYRYALLPIGVAKTIGLGWRKANKDNMVMINLSELKQLPGEGTFEERVTAAGGQIMTPEEAAYYSKTNTFSLLKEEPKVEEKPIVKPEEILPAEPVPPTPLEPALPQGQETPQVQPDVPPVQEPANPSLGQEQTQQDIQTDKNKVV